MRFSMILLVVSFAQMAFAVLKPTTYSAPTSVVQSEQKWMATVERAKQLGRKQIILQAPMGLASSVFGFGTASEDEIFPAGDFLFLLGGFQLEGTDENIREGYHKAILKALEMASYLRFRVIVNLYATSDDLREALQATRPTVINWGAHGDEDGFFYDVSGARVLPDIFKNVSPHVYQFILLSCFGRKGLDTIYRLPSTTMTFAWNGTMTADDLKGFFDSPSWNLLAGRQGPISKNGFFCVGDEKAGYVIADKEGTLINSAYTIRNLNHCAAMLFNSSQNFLCTGTEHGIDIISMVTKKTLPGASYKSTTNELYKCFSKIRTAKDGKICRLLKRDSGTYGIVSSETGTVVGEQRFDTLDDCNISLRLKLK